MKRDVTDFINNCAICRVHQSKPQQPVFIEMPFANYPFENMGIDLIGPFVNYENYNIF